MEQSQVFLHLAIRPVPMRTPREHHLVPMRLRNTPLWLYFRSVRSSEKSVKL
jgi:hypothetical protein